MATNDNNAQNYDAPPPQPQSTIVDKDWMKSLMGILKASEIVSMRQCFKEGCNAIDQCLHIVYCSA